MNRQRSIAASFAVTMLLIALVSACNKGEEKAVKGPNAPSGTGHDTVSDLALSEDGLGQIQIGMTLDEAVNMGLLNENPNMNPQCDFVFPAVGAGIPDGVSVMVVKGRVARIDVDTGSVTTEDGIKVGDSADRRVALPRDAQLRGRPFRAGAASTKRHSARREQSATLRKPGWISLSRHARTGSTGVFPSRFRGSESPLLRQANSR